MARKLNKNVVGILTLLCMGLLAVGGIVLLRNMPGQDPAVYAAKAKELEDQKKYNEAMQTYARAYNKDAMHDPEYLVKAARCAVEDGDIANARTLIQQARVKNSNLRSAAELSTKLEMELAQLFGGALQWTTVMEEAKKLAVLDEQSSLVQQALGSAYASLSDQEEGYEEKAEAALRRAWELDPTNVDVVKYLAAMRWVKVQRKMQEKKQKEVDALTEDVYALLQSAAEKCAEQGNEKAANDLKRERGMYQIRAGSVKEGLAALEKLAEDEKTEADAHLLLGNLYSAGVPDKLQRDLDKAEGYLKTALEIDPKNGETHAALAQVYALQRELTKDPAEAEAKRKQQADVYKRGLEEIERSKHFRLYKNIQYRVDFITELCLQDVQRAEASANPEQKAAALQAAEEWVDKLKQEVNLESTPVRYLTAHILNARRDYVGAIREAEAADRAMQGRRDFRLVVLLGDLYMTQKLWGAARDAYMAALEDSQKRGALPPVLFLRLAQVYLQMDQPKEALRFVEPSQPRALQEYMENNQMARALRIEAHRQLGEQSQVEKESAKLLEGSPDDPLLQARLLLLQDKKEEAEAKLKAILDKKPDDMGVIRLLLQLYASSDRVADAQALTKALLQRDPSNREYQELDILAKQLSGELSEEEILKFIGTEPDEYVKAIKTADYYASKQRFEEARKRLDEAERLKPDEGGCIDRQFRVALMMKDWERAEKYATRSAALNYDGTEGKLAQGRLAIGKAEAEKAAGHADAALVNYQRAIDALTVAVQKFPKNAIAWTTLAQAYGSADRPSEAKETLKQALQIDPTNGYANRALAAIAINENDDKATEIYLRAAANALPNDTWVQERMRILNETKNPREGIASREKIRKEKPEDVENLVLLARLYGDAKVAEFDKATEAYMEALKLAGKNTAQTSTNNDLLLAREIAGFLGREDVNRPSEGEALLDRLMKQEEDKVRKALIAVYLGQFYEGQKTTATADRYFRLAVSINPAPEVLTFAAEFCSRNNQLPQALEFYERVAKTAGDNPGFTKTARMRMIALLLTLGDMDRAREQIDAYVKAYPDDAQGMVYEGAYHRMGGDIQKAKQAFDAFLEKNPDNTLALWQRGQLYILLGRWEAAIADLKRAKLTGKDAFGYQHRIALADALIEAGKGEEGIAELRSIIDEKPEELAVAEALVEAYTKVVPPRYADAETLLYTLMRQAPKDPKWPRLLGRLGDMAQDWNKAITGYEKAAEISRYQPEIVTALFRAYRNANRPQDIIRFATEKLTSRTLANAPEALSSLAWAYSQTHDEAKCLETYDLALAAAGEDVVRSTGVTVDMVKSLGKEAALERAKARAEADPESPDKKKVLVHLMQLNDRTEEAIQLCREVSKLALNTGDSVFAELGEGMLQERLQRYPEAKAKYEAALKLEPNQTMALNNLAYLLVDKMDNASEALPYAERAKKLDPGSQDILDTYGWVLAKKGRLGEALGVLLRALDLNRESVSVLYHLGLVHEMRGELEDARARLLSAKQVAEREGRSPEMPKINEALQRLEKVGR